MPASRLTRVIRQQQIDAYGFLNGDTLAFHYDAATARAKGFRGPVVHGTMLAAMVVDAALSRHGPAFLRDGVLELRFVAPACADDVLELVLDDEGSVIATVDEAMLVTKGTVGLEQP